jgi:hypothetical protein
MLSVKLPNLQLKTVPKQLLGSLPLAITLTGSDYFLSRCKSGINKDPVWVDGVKSTPKYDFKNNELSGLGNFHVHS